MGLFHRDQEKDYLKAIQYYQQSLAIARGLGNPEPIAMALNNLGNNQLDAKQFSEAEKSLREAIDIWDKFRSDLPDRLQVSQFDTLVTYILLQRVLVAQKRYDEALETAIDSISKSIPDFHFGRLDIVCKSVEAMKAE